MAPAEMAEMAETAEREQSSKKHLEVLRRFITPRKYFFGEKELYFFFSASHSSAAE